VRVPELPILDASGGLSEVAQDIVLAIMAYPEDEDRQEELLASLIVEKYQDHPRCPEILAGLTAAFPWFAAALYRSSTPAGVLSAARKATGSAWAAGEILVSMLAVSIHHPEINVGLSMTIDVLEEFNREGPARIGNRTLWDAWSRFRSVSHFYAVRRLWDVSYEDPEGVHWDDWTTADFDEYLATAEDLRKVAITRRFLFYDETWRVPDSFALPPAQIQPGPLLPELLDLFRRYRPKHSKW
jgi:hypothetical protein